MPLAAPDFRARLLPIMLGQVIGLACGLIGVRLSSHLVAPEDYGHYGVFVSLAPVGMWVVFAGLIKFASRNWAGSPDRSQLLHEVMRAARRKTPWLVAAVCMLTVVAAPRQPWLFGAALLLTASAMALTQLAQTTLQAERRHWLDCLLSAAVSLMRTFLPLLFYVTAGATALAMQGGFAAYAVLASWLGFWWLRRHWLPEKAGAPSLLSPIFDGPLFTVLALAGWCMNGLNRWLTAGFYGAEAAGYYNLAANIGAIAPAMLGGMMLQYLLPGWYAPHDGAADHPHRLIREVDRTAALYTGAALGLTLLLHALMPVLVGTLVSERYAMAADLVLPAGCFATAVMIGSFFHSLMLATRRESGCGPADLSGVGVLTLGALAGALAGWEWFQRWLMISPLVPWLVNRTLAHRAVLKRDAARVSAADR